MLRNRSRATIPTSVAAENPSVTTEIEREYSLFNLDELIHETDDPLEWWRTRKNTYPLLATLARRVLAVPATSASAERLFSKAGLTLTDKRNRLSGDSVELLVWLREAWQPLEDYENKIKRSK
jgi:hypothetical protein